MRSAFSDRPARGPSSGPCRPSRIRQIAYISAAFRLLRNDFLYLISATFLVFLGALVFPFEPKSAVLRSIGIFAMVIAIALLGAFASMNRSPLLSLLTGSKPGDPEIFSLEYAKKAAALFTVPTLSLVATAFPQVRQPLVNAIWPFLGGTGK